MIAPQLLVALGASASTSAAAAAALRQAADRYGINTPVRVSHWLAQLMHESEALHYTEELASGQAYEGRRDLGNVLPGDGRLYKGRGYIQITGRANYRRYSAYVRGRDRSAPDFERYPDKLEEIRWAADSAGWFWRYGTPVDLNTLADRGDVLTITRRINGGLRGYDDRLERLKVARIEVVRQYLRDELARLRRDLTFGQWASGYLPPTATTYVPRQAPINLSIPFDQAGAASGSGGLDAGVVLAVLGALGLILVAR